jgi:hypothetical protein
MARPSFREIVAEKEFWLLFIVGLLYFYQPLFFGETFFFRDLYSHFYPHKKLLIDYWNQKSLPLWDPYIYGGTPYLGNINNNVLYPTNILYFILPTVTAFNLDIVLHLILSTLATYTFARILGFARTSSLLAGIIYGYCGYTLSHINLFIRLLSMPYLPLLLTFWHLYLLEMSKRWFVFAVLSSVLQLFAGAAEMTVITLFLALGWTIFFPYQQYTLVKKSLQFALLVLFLAGIAAIQILPTAEMVSLSQRWQGIDFAQFSSWSVNPRRLPELVLPEFFGRTDTLSRSSYWGNLFEDEDHPYIVSMYFGWVPILLALTGGLLREVNGKLPIKLRRFFLIVFLGSVLLSLGRHLPLFRFMYEVIPAMSVFRYPVKFLLAGVFPVAILAGCACEIIFARQNQNRKLILAFCTISILMLLLTALIIASPKFSSVFQQLFFGSDHGRASQLWLFKAFLHSTIATVLVAVVLWNRNWKGNPSWLIIAIVSVDLLIAGSRVNPLAPKEFLTMEPQVVQEIRKKIKDGKLYRVPARHARLRAPSDDIVWGQRWDLEVLNFFLSSFYKIPAIFHEDIYGMASHEQAQLKTSIDSLDWNKRVPILSAAGVSLILTSEDLKVPGLQKILILENKSDTPFYLYRNKFYSGPVRFLSTAQNPCNAQIQKIQTNLGSSKYRVRNSCEGLLIYSDLYYPGWRVMINDHPGEIIRVEEAYSGVRLRAGDQIVKRYYLPASFISGAIISGVSICLLIGFTVVRRKSE